MNSVPFYRDFVAAGASAYRPRGEPGLAQRGLLRRVVDAIALSHQRAVERDITPGSPTKLSAACLNVLPAIVASGRERRRNLSEETDNGP